MINAASILIRKGAKNILIKGGHLSGSKISDVLVNKKETYTCEEPDNIFVQFIYFL